MSYALEIPPILASLLEELPRRTRLAVHARLCLLADAVERWPSDDPRWGRLARREGEELRLYVDGCCLCLQVEPGTKRLAVREVGRVIVQLPPETAARLALIEPTSNIRC